MVGIAAPGFVFRDPPAGGRSGNTDAAGAPLHVESGLGDPVPRVLVLDVGRAWSNSRCADAGDSEDRLRSRAVLEGIGAFSRGLSHSDAEAHSFRRMVDVVAEHGRPRMLAVLPNRKSRRRECWIGKSSERYRRQAWPALHDVSHR